MKEFFTWAFGLSSSRKQTEELFRLENKPKHQKVIARQPYRRSNLRRTGRDCFAPLAMTLDVDVSVCPHTETQQGVTFPLVAFGLRTSRKTGSRGFSLLEILVVMTIIAILGATLAPAAFQIIDDSRESATRAEMESNHRAIVGDPHQGQYGYAADLGGLPTSLADLNTNPGAPVYNGDNLLGIGLGWNGPYINSGYAANNYLLDAWGRDYLYDSNTGQITSLGSDGLQATHDDLVVPATAVSVRGDISVTVTVADGQNSKVTRNLGNDAASVWIYYSANGEEQNAAAVWDNNNQAFTTYSWTTHPHQGMHAVKVIGLDNFSGTEAVTEALVYRGTTFINVFLGFFDLNQGNNGNGNGNGPDGTGPPGQN
ncbi:MAG: prepilin-type N-terminal cleavage/methylation domain-containing protein [Candidatus Schekmanbacteria bacterium]|nr:prepilin-type N-terminal cleavage/methylation domain-containing protein [Candidatus Schekmanbacteria bacterium]